MTPRQILHNVQWYGEVTGESAYDKHVEHLRRVHPDTPPVSRRDLERAGQDERSARPRSRCY